MSYAADPVKVVLVRDKRTIVDNERFFAVVKSGENVRYQAWPTSSISTNSITWTCTPPSANTIMDRRIKMVIPVRLRITGIVAPGRTLLNPNRDAPRQFPIHAAANTFIANINGLSITQQIADTIHPMLNFNTNGELLSRDYSLSPSCPDRTQNYNDLVGEIGNPLSMNGDANFEDVVGRGGFSGYKVIDNPQNNTNQNAELTSYVDMLICEQVMMSPFYWGNFQEEGSGFYNVTAFSFTINFLTQGGNRMWSHADDPSISVVNDNGCLFAFSNFDSFGSTGIPFSFEQNQPLLLINYITPLKELPGMSRITPSTPITYPYFQVTPNPTDVSFIPVQQGSNRMVIQGNNIQLQSLPRRIMVFCRWQNQTLFTNPKYTDSYFKINKLTISFNNKIIMSDAVPQELYDISRGNHLNLPYSDFIGQPMYKVGGNFDNDNRYYGRGTILCFDPALNFGLHMDEAAGLGGQWNFQILNADVENITGFTPTNAQVSLYAIFVYEGAFTITGQSSATNSISILSPNDVRNAAADPSMHVDYNDTQKVNGGSFLSNIKDLNNALKKNKYISKAANAVSKVASAPFVRDLPYASDVSGFAGDVRDVASHFGYGGGEIMGGAMVKHGDLYKRIKKGKRY